MLFNQSLSSFIHSKKIYKHYKLMFHITSEKSAKNIMKNGVDISKSTRGAFGIGINLTNDIKHLSHYYDKKTSNTIIVCLVKYNKLKLNSSNINNNEFFKKFGYSKPKYEYVPKGYEGFFFEKKKANIFVFKSKKYVFPLYTFQI